MIHIQSVYSILEFYPATSILDIYTQLLRIPMSVLSQFGGGSIKSIQRGTITVTAATSGTATITAVDTTKTELRYLGASSESSWGGDFRIALTNSTTITATNAQVVTASVSWELTEYY